MRRTWVATAVLSLLGCGGSGRIETDHQPPPEQDLPEDPDQDLQGEPDVGEIAITSPEDNLLTNAVHVDVTGVVRSGGFTEVELGGETVSVAPDGTFTGEVRLDQEGPNEIHARAGGADAWIVVRRDTLPPTVTMRTPERGAYVDATHETRVEVTGQIDDAHGLRSVTVNGGPAEVDASGAFRYVDEDLDPGLHYYAIESTDNAGNHGGSGLSVLYGEFAPVDEIVPDAVVGLVGPSVLDTVADAAGVTLESIDLQSEAMAQNPLLDEWWATLELTSLTRGGIDLDLTPTEAGLEATVRLSDLDTAFSVDLVGPYNPDGTAWADAAVLTATLDVWATESGTIDAALVDSVVSLEGFGFDLVPTGIEDWELVRGTVQGMLESTVQAQVEALLPSAIAAELQALDLSREIDVQGIPLFVDVRPSIIEIDRGGITVRADGALYGEQTADAPRVPGTLRTPSAPPQLSGDRLTVSFADDVLNQVLTAAWQAGQLDREVPLVGPDGPVVFGALSLFFNILDGMVPNDTPVIATLDPQLPPVAHLGQGGATLEIGELHVKLEADTPGARTYIMTVALHVTAELAADFGDGASVSLSLLDWSLSADPVEAPEGFPNGDTFHRIMDNLVGQMAPDIQAPLASLPLPGFVGFGFSGLAAATDGPGADYLTLSCDLDGI